MLFIKGYEEELKSYVDTNKKLFLDIKNKSLVITGAAGLIGSYLIDLIITANKYLYTEIKVCAVDKNKELLDIRFPEFFNEHIKKFYLDINIDEIPVSNADYVIHAASNTSPADYASKPISTMRTNLVGTERMLDLSIKNKSKFLFCSSVEAYGMNNGDTDEFDESYSGYVDCNTLRAGYPSAKRAAEALSNAYAQEYKDFKFTIARIGRIYGPTVIADDIKAPTQFIKNAVCGEDIILKSSGTQEYSYAYVGDCATALLFILFKGECGGAYNVADPDSRTFLRDFAGFAAKAGGTKVVFQIPSDIESSGYSKITKAVMSTAKLEALGWTAKYHSEEGVARTVRYLKAMQKV